MILLLVLLLAGSLVLSNSKSPIKYQVYSVDSGSMEPTIKVGSLIVVMPKDRYEKEDIITFRDGENPSKTITHRVVEISEDVDLGLISYETKGDANEDADALPIGDNLVIGKVQFALPYLGYPIGFAKTQMGFALLIIIPATIIAYSELENIKKEIKLKMNNKKKPEKDEAYLEEDEEDEEEPEEPKKKSRKTKK